MQEVSSLSVCEIPPMLRMVRPGWVKDQVAFFSGMSTRSQQQDAFYKLLIELQKSRGYTIH